MILVLIGNTGAGKSTAADYLEKTQDYKVISSGRIARSLVSQDPAIDTALNQGMPAPEEAMRLHVQHAFLKAVNELKDQQVEPDDWRILLEGYPRTLAQLITVKQWTPEPYGALYVHLMCPVMTCIERLISRARPDDNPDSIARKLDSYRNHTKPMLDVLREAAQLYTIFEPGDKSMELLGQLVRSPFHPPTGATMPWKLQ